VVPVPACYHVVARAGEPTNGCRPSAVNEWHYTSDRGNGFNLDK
jgi:hypothetical protein